MKLNETASFHDLNSKEIADVLESMFDQLGLVLIKTSKFEHGDPTTHKFRIVSKADKVPAAEDTDGYPWHKEDEKKLAFEPESK